MIWDQETYLTREEYYQIKPMLKAIGADYDAYFTDLHLRRIRFMCDDDVWEFLLRWGYVE